MLFTAYSIVRTVPSANRPNRRKKKLCGQLLRLVLIPCHVEGELHPWTRSTALSFAAELDGHVLGTLCAVTMCESLCPLQGYNLALVRPAIH